MATFFVNDLARRGDKSIKSFMKSFSIRDLENLSGVKTHTIRMWEKRYQLFLPQRNKGNFRYYSFDQLKYLLDLVLLINSGFKISGIAKLDDLNLKNAVDSLVNWEQRQSKSINSLICFMFCSDIEEFEAILDDCVLSWGIDKTIGQVIIPFLEKTGILSYSDSSSEVHFVVTAIRKKIILGIEKLNTSKKVEKTALLFLPQNEHYDLVLLYMSYLLKYNGLKVLYLGTDISIENLNVVIQNKKPDYLYTYVTHKTKTKNLIFLNGLEQKPAATKIFVAVGNDTKLGNDLTNLNFIHYKETASSLEERLELS